MSHEKRGGMTEGARAQPVAPEQRIPLIDILRGFALTGVLLVNMMSYGAYDDQWTGSVDQVFRVIEIFFFENRFWHLFSLLFGLGFAIQWRRACARETPFVAVYLRRLAYLFAFGAAGNVLWRIDILSDYAVLGLLLLPLRRWSAGAVLVLVAVTHLAPSVIGMGRESLSEYRAPDRDVVEQVSLGPAAETGASSGWREEEHSLRADGSFFEVVAGHARQYMVELKQPSLQPSFGQWWGYLSMFLLGLYLGKRRVLTEYRKHRAMARQAAGAGLLLGVVVMTHATWEHLGGNPRSLSPPAAAALEALSALGSTGFMLFYVYLISEWSFTQRSKWLQTGFAAVGRTALSNYLLQSSLINVIFMGWGFGLYQRLGPGLTMTLSIPLYAALMALSVWWIRRFRYGPAEWVWRTLTYGTWQPMRAAHDRAEASP